MRRLRRPVAVGAVVVLLLQMLAVVAVAEAPANEHFQRTWARTDQPVASGQVSRTWMWGPEAFTAGIMEDYAESPGGKRQVQYFDKSRMEITNPGGDSSSIWYVTNGLLVVEMMTGEMQVGDNTWETRWPAEVNVAGDSDDPNGPTYATFVALSDGVSSDVGATVTERVDRAGMVSDDAGLASHQVALAIFVPETGHHVASVFWDFMRAEGLVYENGSTSTAALFPNPYYATGFPIAEPYWATVLVGGTAKDVLMQCFERRCLTYTPDNPAGWQVEAGNVGQHYYAWRYESDPPPVEVYRMPYIHRHPGEFSTIYTMNSDGTDQKPIGLPSSLWAFDLSFSADGQLVAFIGWDAESDISLGTQIYTINIDGSNLQEVTAPEEGRQIWSLEWSPDGTRIAFVSLDMDASGDQHNFLYTINPDGSSEQRLTDDEEAATYATWSPDGQQIAYTTNRDCDGGAVRCIWIVDADGSNAEMLLQENGGFIRNPEWSPDGSEIAYMRVDVDSEPTEVSIIVVSLDGTPGRVLHTNTNGDTLRWDPSGNWIYFAQRSNDWDVFMMDRNGNNLQQITDQEYDQFSAAPPVR